jgi:hypothetical protein
MEIRQLIFRMVADNPTWRAPRIHGELAMLGCEVSERSVARWMRRAPRSPDFARRWLTFLRNRREGIAAMDFFMPTLTFHVLYCFFVLGHDRRRILHFNVTRHPTSAWIVQQLRETFPYETAAKILVLDHDSKYGSEVPVAIDSMGITAVRTGGGLPLAQWCRGTVGRKLPSRTTGPRDCDQRIAFEAAARCLRRLLPPGPHALWTSETDTGKATALLNPRLRACVASRRGPSSSLRARRLREEPPSFLPWRIRMRTWCLTAGVMPCYLQHQCVDP